MARKRQSTKYKNTRGRNKLDLDPVANTSTKKGSTNEATKKLEANPRIDQLEKQLQAHEQEIQSNMAKLKQDTQALKDRKQDILDRQQALLQQNGGTQVAGHDIIRLNVSGTEMFARRDTLTVVEGSRLEALFSGRWENQLMRDALGRVFMEVKIDAFKKILEYLYMVKLSRSVSVDSSEGGGNKNGENDPLLPPIESKANQEAFDKYMNFFRLNQGAAKDGNREDFDKDESTDKTAVEDIVHNKRAILDVMEKELDKMEKRLSAEESFVKLFLTDDSAYSHSLSDSSSYSSHDISSHFSSDISSDTSSIVDVTHGNSLGPLKQDISHSIHDEDIGILNLLVGGELLVIKRSTLCHDPNSKLAQDFSNDEWLKEHLVVTEQGKRCFLVEQPLSAFQKLLDQIHLKTISSDEDALPPIKLDYNGKNNDLFIRMYDYYFPGGSNVIELYKPPPMDSAIVEESSDVDKLQEWLQSVNHNAAPKLLYRASRDGWDANDFHRACDGKGATITIVKSSGGYIFGGFTDKSWSSNGGYESSDNAFMFHLKCHSGVPAEKYGMRKDYNGGHTRYAMCLTRSCGPTFGYNSLSCGYDLQIVSNANVSFSHCDGIGNSYTSFAWNHQKSFLTGSYQFLVSEYEVFQV